MKKVLLSLVFTTFMFWGCAENTSLTGPEKIESQNTFLKINAEKASLMKKSEVSKTIDGKRGGLIRINLAAEEDDFGARGWLYFGRKSFDGKKVITVKTDKEYAALDFYPEGIDLNKPARLTVLFKGLDLEENSDIDFQYIDENGNLAPVDYRKLIVYKKLGWVIVIDARLNHFSRYGFTK